DWFARGGHPQPLQEVRPGMRGCRGPRLHPRGHRTHRLCRRARRTAPAGSVDLLIAPGPKSTEGTPGDAGRSRIRAPCPRAAGGNVCAASAHFPSTAPYGNPRMNDPRHDPSRQIRAPRGSALSCRSWLTEAPFRMLQNNLDAEVAEDPASLVVYGGIGRAARDWACYDAILETLRTLGDDETLLVQSGKPVGVFRTHADAP